MKTLTRFELLVVTEIVVVTIVALFSVAVAFARQPALDLAADAMASMPPWILEKERALLDTNLVANLAAAETILTASESRFLYIGDSYVLYCPAAKNHDTICLPGHPIAEIRQAVASIPVKSYSAIIILAGIANLSVADLAQTREELAVLAREVERKYAVRPIVFDPAQMLLLAARDDLRYGAAHLKPAGYAELFSNPNLLDF